MFASPQPSAAVQSSPQGFCCFSEGFEFPTTWQSGAKKYSKVTHCQDTVPFRAVTLALGKAFPHKSVTLTISLYCLPFWNLAAMGHTLEGRVYIGFAGGWNFPG